MPTIEISQETYEALGARVQGFSETPESVIRRLLALAPEQEKSAAYPSVPTEDPALVELVRSDWFQRLNGRDRYLGILKFLHDKNQGNFSKLLKLQFGKRIQIATSSAEIENSGKSTFPERVPGTGFWALTNLSNNSKRDVILAAMHLLGYREADIRLAVNSIPNSQVERSKLARAGY